jgi:hypothetical protein
MPVRGDLWLRIEPLLPLPASFNNLLGNGVASTTIAVIS